MYTYICIYIKSYFSVLALTPGNVALPLSYIPTFETFISAFPLSAVTLPLPFLF